jgi:hypothetical protein
LTQEGKPALQFSDCDNYSIYFDGDCYVVYGVNGMLGSFRAEQEAKAFVETHLKTAKSFGPPPAPAKRPPKSVWDHLKGLREDR